MLHKARARNARTYGHGGVMRSYFFPQYCRGAHRAPVIAICENFGFAHLLRSEKENWKNREEKRGEVRYKREGATKKDRLTAAVHIDLY